MPPYLHPRSRATTSLFTMTLAASFLIISVPHAFPCPVPRSDLADSGMMVNEEGRCIRRRRRKKQADSTAEARDTPSKGLVQREAVDLEPCMSTEEEAMLLAKRTRECPVPKPRGLVGHLLGFKIQQSSTVDGDGRERERRRPSATEKPV